MEFRDVIARRRMIRRFQPDVIAQDVVDRIADVIRRGPSAGFAQGVAVIVVTSADRRQAIAKLAGEAAWIARGKDPWLSESPAHLVVCVEPTRYRSRYDESDKDPAALDIPWWWVDGGAAMMLGLLAAVDEGLGAGFIGAHAVPGLRGILDLPDEVEPLGIITVGHPAAHPASRSLRRGRRPSREVVHRETWGGGS